MTLRLDNYQLKDATTWSAAEVRSFLESILPGHPAVDCFTYTQGHVLCSLTKDDLRRQAKDDEVANVIWAELRRLNVPLPAGQAEVQAPAARSTGFVGGGSLTVYVKTQREAAFEFDIMPSDNVGSLKARIEEIEGTPADRQRLTCGGIMMQDPRPLGSYNLHHGATILLVPRLRGDQRETTAAPKAKAFWAPRGLLCVPGTKAWQTTPHPRPFVPVLFHKTPTSFPVEMEFQSSEDCEAFAAAAREAPPVLEISNAKPGGHVLETFAHLDYETGGVLLEMGGEYLGPSKRYDALLRLGGKSGVAVVAVYTGVSATGAA